MLRLLPRLEVIAAGGLLRLLPDPMPAAEGSQSRIGEIESVGLKFFMDSDQIPLAGGIEFQDLLPVRLGFLRAEDPRRDT